MEYKGIYHPKWQHQRNYELILSLVIGSFLCLSCTNNSKNENDQKPNVLFISIDDLRPELGCYGREYIHSPNIDLLASESTVFTRHYVQVPTCGASRYAMLTGMLPKTKDHTSNRAITKFISNRPDSISSPETFIHHFKNNGYHTIGIGKISHSGDGYVYGYKEPKSQQVELPNSWSDLDFNPGQWGNGWNAFFAYANGESRETMDKQVKPYEAADTNDLGLPDGLTAELAIEKLRSAAKMDKPFFMGLGFFKPHLPFTAPKKYWNIYDRNKIELAPYDSIPQNSSPASLQNNGEFNNYLLGEEKPSLNEPLSDEYARKIRHAYFASVSYTDAQVGKVLAEIKRLGLDKNTIIVLWGDHGYNLGDHRVWGKHTLFEKSLKSAFIVKIPGIEQTKISDQIVSTIDLYPTLVELCGLEMPHPTDGKSFTNALLGDDQGIEDEYAYGYYRNGITLRTDRYRLMKYYREETPVIELYDYFNDPNESRNIAADYPEIVEELMPILEKGNTGLYE